MPGRGLGGIISLFGFGGLSASPIVKSSSDTGVGADSEELAQAIADADSGAGVEGTEVVAPTILSTDAGVGVESVVSLAATVVGTDVGTGAESESYSMEAAKSDAGVGVESESLTVEISDSDLGVGIDSESLALDRLISVEITSIESFRTIEYT